MTNEQKEIIQNQFDRHELWLKCLTIAGFGSIICVLLLSILVYRYGEL